jgi:threonine dehydrogenase-like Zn-dependent dehydrogenase
MRALRFDDQLYLSISEPEPVLETGEALIKLRLAGICQTDLELTHGYRDFHGVLGHEFVGELVQDAGEFRAGQRVVGSINIPCNRCDFCQRGIPSQCRNRTTLGINHYPGTFADYLRLPIGNLYGVPDSVPDEAAVFTEPLAAAFQITELAHVHPSDRVIVIGAGKLGLLVSQVLHLTGCDLIVIARQPRSIEVLTEWGIPYVDMRGADWQRTIPGKQANLVVDCAGSAEGFGLALDLLQPRGTLVLKSTYMGLPTVDLTRVAVEEINIIGSRCGSFPAALRMMAAGLVDTQPLIEKVYSLDDAITAFEYAAQRGVLKVLLKP